MGSNRRLRRQRSADDDRLDRLHMLEFNQEKIEMHYLLAKESGLEDPVVFLVDPRDRIGRQAAVAFLGEDKVKELIADCAAKGMRPTVHFPMERALAVKALVEFAPGSSRIIETCMLTTAFWAVCIAEGGTQCASLPIPQPN